MPLGTDHARQIAVQDRHDPGRVERLTRPIDERGDAVFLGLGHVVGKAVKLFRPHGMFVCLFEIEKAGVQDRIRRNVRSIRFDDPGVGVEAADDLARGIDLFGSGVGDLVEDDHIGELDLIGQQMDQRALVLFTHGFAPVVQEIVAGIVVQQVHRIDHRHHRVETRDIRQAFARLIPEIEGGGDGQRLGYPGGFDQQVVEPSFPGQLADLLQQVVAQGAADAAVGHLDQCLVGARQFGICADKVGVDVHLGHVIDDDGDTASVAVVQDAVQQGRLARA